ncbi:hypothetical protein [Haloferula sargassicola]|uniref:Uncharacterized protein n=1 Tax=Haloferula sargassicola TaxID=490096 RepID=A0ABP9UVR6_9BACT
MDQPPTVPGQDLYLRQRDEEHLRLLVIFHYIYAGLVALGASIPIIHLVIGIFMVIHGFTPDAGEIPFNPGWLFIGMASAFIVIGWTFAVLMYYAGRSLSQRRNRTFVFVMACLACLQIPMGTVLGIFTILVLQRPSVLPLFAPGGTPYSKV